MPNLQTFDVVVIGGGPAGLSAALVLGRACRSVLVCDGPESRNSVTQAVHGFLTRDGIAPSELRRIGRDQLAPYDVTVREVPVVGVAPVRGGPFVVTLEDGTDVAARRVLLATGMKDRLPDIPGFSEVYGVSAHHCPYCDGWEHRDKAIMVYAGDGGATYAHTMRAWSNDVTILTDGKAAPKEAEARRLFGRIGGIRVITNPVEAILSSGQQITAVRFVGGDTAACDAFFFHLGMDQASRLPAQLRCAMTRDGFVRVDQRCATSVPGVYAAGDLTPGPQSVALAAAEGMTAAASINQSVWDEDTL